MKKLILVLVFLLFSPIGSWAEKPVEFKFLPYLQSEPATLFDLGLFKMELSAQRIASQMVVQSPATILTSSLLSGIDNKFYLLFILNFDPISLDKNVQAEEWFSPDQCEKRLRDIHVKLGFYIPSSYKKTAIRKAHDWFGHGRAIKPHQEAFYELLAERIRIELFYGGVEGHYGGSCAMSLKGEDLTLKIGRKEDYLEFLHNK